MRFDLFGARGRVFDALVPHLGLTASPYGRHAPRFWSLHDLVNLAIVAMYKALFTGDLPYKKLHPWALAPRRAHPTDAGLDLAPIESALLGAGETAKLATGIAMEIPPGFMGLLLSRSSAKARQLDITNVIDASYRGDVMISVTNIGNDTQHVEGLKYLAQLVVLPCALLEPRLVEELSRTPRGTAGFGSTGG